MSNYNNFLSIACSWVGLGRKYITAPVLSFFCVWRFFTHLSEALLHSYIQLLLRYQERLLIPDFKFWNTHEILTIYLSSLCTVNAMNALSCVREDVWRTDQRAGAPGTDPQGVDSSWPLPWCHAAPRTSAGTEPSALWAASVERHPAPAAVAPPP